MSIALSLPALAQSPRYDALANHLFTEGWLSKEGLATVTDELVSQRAVQSYPWALPA
jgi:hypothetical protein